MRGLLLLTLALGACSDDGSSLQIGAPGPVAPRGFLRLTVTGGSPPYAYALSDDRSGGAVDERSGVYRAGPTGEVSDRVTVSDAGGARAEVILVVGPPLRLAATMLEADPLEVVPVEASGGAPPYECRLDQAASGGSLEVDPSGVCRYRAGLVQGQDVVSVTDANGASAEMSVSVGGAFAVAPASARVAPLERLVIGAFGGGRDYRFTLSSGPSGGSVTPRSGVYSAGPTGQVTDLVSITDGAGASATVPITVGPALALAPATASVGPTETVSLAASGGKAPYLFQLAGDSGGSVVAGGSGATYSAGTTGGVDVVTVTDAVGAAATSTITVADGVRFSPSEFWVAPLEGQALSLAGTAGPATFSMASAPSGGSVSATGATTAQYTAGPSGSVDDEVQATGAWGYPVIARIHVGPTLAIAPAGAATGSGGTLTFTASGGKAPYQFEAVSLPSGGSITSGGLYTAGGSAATDSVRVRDAVGATATTTIVVTATPPPELAVAPGAAVLAPGTTQVFTASGGCGVYAFELVAPAAGTLTALAPEQVTYGAPASAADDLLRVTACAEAVTVAIDVQATPTLTFLWPRGGAPGNVVTIVGDNFAATPSANTVRFGTDAALVLRGTPTSLMVRVPSRSPGAPASLPVTVATTDGTSGSLPFVVLPSPTPLPLVISRQLSVNNNDLYLTDTHYGAAPKRLTDYGREDTQPAISPDGHWLVWLSDEDSSGGGSNDDIYRIDLSAVGGTVPTPANLSATPTLNESFPTFAPDGNWLYFKRGASQVWRMRFLAPDPASTAELVDDGGGAPTDQFRLTPDGRWLLFTANRTSRFALYRKAADGGGPVVALTSGVAGGEWDPFVSPAGDRVYFNLFGSTTAVAWVDPLDSGVTPTILPAPPLPANAYRPHVSWDGLRISIRENSQSIWLGDLDGASGATIVGDRRTYNPIFTADGASIIYYGETVLDGPFAVYRYDLAAAASVLLEAMDTAFGAVGAVPLP